MITVISSFLIFLSVPSTTYPALVGLAFSIENQLATQCCPSAVHFSLRYCSGSDQPSDAGVAQTITMAPHAILETARFETPLATETAVIFSTFSLAGLGDTN
jgi:hypothetical protein